MLQRRRRDLFVYLLQKVLQGLFVIWPLLLPDCLLCTRSSCLTHYLNIDIWIRYQGHILAKELVEKGVQTTVITDSAVFAMISRVNMVHMCVIVRLQILYFYYKYNSWFYLKVIVGAHAVMANGGVIAPVGMNMVALAAQRHAVPFVVVAGSHKVCLCT